MVISWDCVDWILLDLERDQWQVLQNTVNNFLLSNSGRNVLKCEEGQLKCLTLQWYQVVYVTPVPWGLCDPCTMGSMWPQYHGVYVTPVPWGLCDPSTMGSMWPQYHEVYVTPSPLWLTFSFKLSWILKSRFMDFFVRPSYRCHTHLVVFVSFRLFFIRVYFRLRSNGPHSSSHVIYIFLWGYVTCGA
jgi:hypothetical protein